MSGWTRSPGWWDTFFALSSCHPERSEGSARWRVQKPIWSRARGARAPAPRGERSRSKRAALATPDRRAASSASEKQILRPLRSLRMTITLNAQRSTTVSDPLWYKDAIIYQTHVKSFRDENADGYGDFRGLTERLDYIQQLGATCVWLLPFYPSPLRDDGYDISSYESINSTYGSIDDFQHFLDAAHARDLKVITELVINHTSDQHPWFQRARRAPKDSRERNWYVWSDDPNKYAGARIIFTDTETSNWTWDPVAQQFFWHRFFSHQPDLNFDNPEVLEAVKNVMRFWLKMGVDGLRLDAIPYLIERHGTNCENLPETHVLLKDLRTRSTPSSRTGSSSPKRISGHRTFDR